MTFSIAARCAETGMFGMAVSSSSPAVAARCAHARAGVGVVSSQNITDPRLGKAALDRMATGASAPEAIAALVAGEPGIAYRQLVAVDAAGRTAVYSGSGTLGLHAACEGPAGSSVAAAGNLLANTGVPAAMVAAYLAARGSFGTRLLAGMAAGMAAGGEAGPVHSAGLLIVRDQAFPVADLRVDWAKDDPIAALARLWAIYEPQLEAYVVRALDPAASPSYGVPGDGR